MSISCSFCNHVNPDGSKYCNECGSPLQLKPCGACEAVNDLDATHCHQCGAELGAGPERAHELAESLRARESVETPNSAEPLRADAAPLFFDQYLTALRREMGSRPKSAEEATETAQEPTPDAAALAAPADTEKHAQPTERPPQINGRDMAPATRPEPEALRPLRVTPIVMPMQRPTSRLLYLLGASLLVIGIVGYGYYWYGLSPRAERWLGGAIGSPSATSQPSMLLATASRAITRLGGDGTPSLPASNAPADGVPADATRTASPASGESSAASAPASVQSAATTSTPATASAPTDAPASTAPATAPAPTATATTTAAQPSATSNTQSTSPAQALESDPAVAPAPDARATTTRVATVSRKNASRAGAKRSEPPRTAAVRMTAPPVPEPPPSMDTSATTRSPLAPVCTNGIAALGLCDPNRHETN